MSLPFAPADLVVSCPAPFGAGGLGRHFAEIVAEARAEGRTVRWFGLESSARRESANSDPDGTTIRLGWLASLARIPPLRFRRDWQGELFSAAFDGAVRRRLSAGRLFDGFCGAALHSMRRAKQLGFRECHLETGIAHVVDVRRNIDIANRRHPIERDWLSRGNLKRTLLEYELADVVWVNSEYTRQTFLAEGYPATKLRRRQLAVDPRYRPPSKMPENAGLHVVFIGSLTVSKGVPDLIEAFARYADPAARLTLIGGSGTRGMSRFLASAARRDPRLRVAPGDPLPHLHEADVCVHPSFSDGFGYGPAEALACGVPVIVSENTGMKELIREGENGWVIPIASPDAILDRLRRCAERPLRAEIAAALGRQVSA